MSEEYATADELTAADLMEESDARTKDGKLVRVRGLTRGEVLVMQTLRSKGIIKDEAQWEQLLLHKAMIKPEMSEQQVAAWHKGPAANMQPVVLRVEELSGMREGAQKSDVPETGE